jgi:chemosensory pili system protein ChpA (sensor histidine kinase/response regulator)
VSLGTMARIFIVDDDRDFLELQERMLSSQGYRVTSFSRPDEALAALRAADAADLPGLLVTDLMMSALDSGFSLARAMKEDPRLARIPVIVVSAVASQKGFDFRPRTQADLAAMNAEAFFDKPVSPQAFIARVKELLG